MGSKRGSRHRLTITAKALAQASRVAFWRSGSRGRSVPKPISGISGQKVISRDQAHRDTAEANTRKKNKNKSTKLPQPCKAEMLERSTAAQSGSIGEPASPSSSGGSRTKIGRTVRRPDEPSQAVVASRPDNRLCNVCNKYFHKTRIGQHLLVLHGIKADAVTAPTDHDIVAAASVKSRPTAISASSPRSNSSPTGDNKARASEMAAMKARIAELETILQANRLQSGPSDGLQTRPSGKVLKSSKKKQTHRRAWTDGQPRFEGGIHWLQGGLPGLGKKH